MRPRIAVPVPTSKDLAYNERNWSAYADCLQASGAEPVAVDLELSGREIMTLASKCRGFCLPGSPADVDPERYGQAAEPATAPADPARERADAILLESALHSSRPLLAICFGLQSLNIFLGGTLVQDLAPMPVNHAAGPAVGVGHTVAVERDSLLARLSGAASPGEEAAVRIPVNSSHHQAVGIPGRGLRVTGRCPQDGVVEAIEMEPGEEHRLLIGVQWHPERSFASPASQGLFAGLVEAAQEWRKR